MNNTQQIQEEGRQAYAPAPPEPGATPHYYERDPRRKSPTLAALLSLMPGLGQIYVGYYQIGFIQVLVVGSLIAILNAGIGALEPLCGLFLAFFWLHSLVDAHRKASLYNQALAQNDWEELTDFHMPAQQGSMFGGVLLICFGSLALAHTKFGYSVDWIEDWWPAALILIGGYLIYKALSERGSSTGSEPSS